MNAMLEKLRLTGIIPVIEIQSVEDALPLAEALLEGGLPCAEVTFRTAAAEESITRIAKSYPEMLLGAGTVLNVEQVKLAVGAGARYIVAPGLNRRVVEYCNQGSIPVIPGVATPTDVEGAMELDLEVVKFFPAEASGGLAYLKAMSGPYKQMKFIPTGGIGEGNLLEYLRFPRTLACGGSWMVKPELLLSRDFKRISELTRGAIRVMLGFDLGRVSFSASGDEASTLARILQKPLTPHEGGNFLGQTLEIRPGGPTLSLETHFLDRALTYLERMGIHPAKEGWIKEGKKPVGAFLEAKIGEFRLAVIQKPGGP